MASDIFIKIDGISGESVDAKHKDEIEALSYSWGVANSATTKTAGGGAGRPSFQDIVFVHGIDKASPKLLAACATGAHIKDATITHRKPGKGQQEYLVIKLNDVIVTGVALSDPSGGPSAENVSLAFRKVDLEYRPQKPDGSLDSPIPFVFDIAQNKIG